MPPLTKLRSFIVAVEPHVHPEYGPAIHDVDCSSHGRSKTGINLLLPVPNRSWLVSRSCAAMARSLLSSSICIFLYLSIGLASYLSRGAQIPMYRYIHMCMYVYIYAYTCIYIYIYTCICLCMYHLHLYLYLSLSIHTYKNVLYRHFHSYLLPRHLWPGLCRAFALRCTAS